MIAIMLIMLLVLIVGIFFIMCSLADATDWIKKLYKLIYVINNGGNNE